MKEIQRILPEEIWSCGIDLENLGIKEIGWDFISAMKVIKILENSACRILGGDVYKMEGSKLVATYDNWYIDKNNTKKSAIERTRNYITSYHEKHGENFLYTLVIE